ncbi:MAG: Malto-oligosyltrehalose trehalohydrolase [Methanosaeta sp. PtaU1.Bin060]|nr:MAG: Malto-oligosyltrehalose trehalohydrolase [Methanosaeta sp. PtaU1.Bin060]
MNDESDKGAAVTRGAFSADEDPLWYKEAIIYEVHIRCFYDSNGDGIGDLQGLIEKLDYLNDLGVTAIWLLPFYPSPLKDDGYDITDYFDIHPDYGDLRTFRRLLKEAHGRGMKVITEMVLNHTSDRHPWFQRARRSKPDSVWRNFYVWSDTPDKYRDARVIFKDFETSNWAWDPVAGSYYWHRFYSHQPDLNYDSIHVQKTMMRVIDFWLRMGVDGIRLDAIPYLYEREGTNCENLPETHEFLKRLRAHVDEKYKNRMLLAEANQWPEDAAVYFGNGDSCHMAYHFPLMPRMFMAVEMEDRFPMVDILEQTPTIPRACQWALFLRNHDELTLEMVTDEERDYMYRVYARDPRTKINLGIRRRLAPLLKNNRRKIELMFFLLFSLPGTPVLYYGDEIGMGDNYYLGDRNGVRTPMQWSPDINAGFSLANPQELYLPVVIDPSYHYEAVNVANQESNPSSLLWWMKQTLALRRRFRAFGKGEMRMLFPGNSKVMAFIRVHQEEKILAIANLSRYAQQVDIDLSEYAGLIPVEVTSRNQFNPIERSPYSITLGPYSYFWFHLVEKKSQVCVTYHGALFHVKAQCWERFPEGPSREIVEEILPAYLSCLGWFGGSGRTIERVEINDRITLSEGVPFHLLILGVDYTEGLSDLCLLMLAFASGEEAGRIAEKYPQSIILRLSTEKEEGIVYDGIYNEALRERLLSMVLHRKRVKDAHGCLFFYPMKATRRAPDIKGIPSDVLKITNNTVYIQFRERFFLKLYRCMEEGDHEIVITRFLTENGFGSIAPFAGGIEFRPNRSETLSVGLLQGFVANEGDAWGYTVDEVGRFLERVLSRKEVAKNPPIANLSLLDAEPQSIPPMIRDLLGGVYLEMAQLLGRHTGEMHLLLASSDAPDFAPTSYTAAYQRSLYQSMRVSVSKSFRSLKRLLKDLPPAIQSDALDVMGSEKVILSHLRKVMLRRLSAARTRVHGDYHLGQLLYTGKDFVLFGFDGRPEQTMEERKLKRSPLLDLASMVVSLHSAACCALKKRASTRKEDLPFLQPWVELWFKYISGVFIGSYLQTIGDAQLLPKEKAGVEALFHAFLLDRAVYELSSSLDKPNSISIALKGILSLLDLMKKDQDIESDQIRS